jgi:2-amino-4-hydroxy-6-hydroxymethyldihydropteridine diphosphokinase
MTRTRHPVASTPTTTSTTPEPAARAGGRVIERVAERSRAIVDPAAEVIARGAPRAAVFVGLGANLGDARATIAAAIDELRELALADASTGMSSFVASSLWRSAPVDAAGPDFLNAVARFETALSPHDLLDALQAIEQRFGRERPYRNAPRTLDLDLLLFGVADNDGGVRHIDDRLELPHPRAAQRAFVLEPLAELWPDGEIPGAGRLADLLARARLDVAQRVELVAS